MRYGGLRSEVWLDWNTATKKTPKTTSNKYLGQEIRYILKVVSVRHVLSNHQKSLCLIDLLKMMRQVAVLALAAIVPFSVAQISDDFESGWNQTKWPIYAPDCNQGGAVTLDSSK